MEPSHANIRQQGGRYTRYPPSARTEQSLQRRRNCETGRPAPARAYAYARMVVIICARVRLREMTKNMIAPAHAGVDPSLSFVRYAAFRVTPLFHRAMTDVG